MAISALLRSILALGSVATGVLGCSENRPDHPVADPVERLTPRMRFAILDRSAAFTVQDSGLVQGLSYVLHDEAVLLWPSSTPARGASIVLGRLARTDWGGAVEAFWQPLVARVSGNAADAVAFGIVAITGTGQDGRVRTTLGRYLMAWQGDSAAPRLRAMLVVGLPLPSLGGPELVAVEGQQPRTLPSKLATADSALRATVAAEGVNEGLARHIAPDGAMFGDDGELLVGPEAIRGALLPSDRARIRMVVEDGGLAADGSVGWTQGIALVTRTSSGPGVPLPVDSLNYLVLWQRGDAGELQVLSAALVTGAAGR